MQGGGLCACGGAQGEWRTPPLCPSHALQSLPAAVRLMLTALLGWRPPMRTAANPSSALGLLGSSASARLKAASAVSRAPILKAHAASPSRTSAGAPGSSRSAAQYLRVRGAAAKRQPSAAAAKEHAWAGGRAAGAASCPQAAALPHARARCRRSQLEGVVRAALIIVQLRLRQQACDAAPPLVLLPVSRAELGYGRVQVALSSRGGAEGRVG